MASEATISDVLTEMTAAVNDINKSNDWYDADRTVGDGIALLHSEVSEMFEAYRDHGTEDSTSGPKPEGYGSECADVLIRLLDECSRQGIDLAYEFVRKCAYNETRGYKHGGKKV